MKDAVDDLAENVARPFEQARAMPRSVYLSDDFLAAEQAHVFAQDWICVGRIDQFAKVGDYVTTTIAGRPIMVIRGKDDVLRAQSNVCLHRMSTLLQGTGNTRSIVCPYHAWTYELDGHLRGAPGMTRNAGFNRGDYCLPQIHCAVWLGWVLVSLSDAPPDLAADLADAAALIAPYGMENYVQTFQEKHNWATNWKVLAENFMESYHLPVCHAGTIGGFVNLAEMHCPPGGRAWNYHAILKDKSAPLTNAHPDNTTMEGDLRRTTVLLTVYPALMITLTPGYFWYLSLRPDGPGRVDITYGGGLSPDYVNDRQAQAHFAQLKDLLDRVNEEDRGCTEAVYRGLSSALARPGHLSHLERPNFEFATYLSGRVQEGRNDA